MKHFQVMISTAALVGLAACLGCSPGGAASGNIHARSIDPQAKKVLRSMSDALSNAQTLSFHTVGIMDKVVETGQLSQYSRSSRIVIARPNKLHMETIGDDVSREGWFDGRTLTLMDKSDNAYVTVETPGTIEQMLDFVIDEYGLTMPMADLLFGDPHETLIANVQSGTYVGQSSVDGHTCHHLMFRQELVDWQIWIDAGDKALPRKFVITYKTEPGQPNYSATMDEWKLSARVSDDMFTFRPPENSQRVEITDLLVPAEGEE